MPYKKIRASEIPKRPRKAVSRLEKTEEWKLMKADLDKGLKPNVALQLLLTDDDKKKYGIKNRRSVVRFLQKYFADHKLPYSLKSFHRDSGDFFLIQNPRTK
jgi:hypothetical protein